MGRRVLSDNAISHSKKGVKEEKMFVSGNVKWALGISMATALAATMQAAVIENPVIANICGAYNGALASTCQFNTGNVNRTGDPVSARTDFVEEWDSIGYDGLTLATHELFH